MQRCYKKYVRKKMLNPANNPRRRLEMDRVLVLCSHRLRCLVLQAHLG